MPLERLRRQLGESIRNGRLCPCLDAERELHILFARLEAVVSKSVRRLTPIDLLRVGDLDVEMPAYEISYGASRITGARS